MSLNLISDHVINCGYSYSDDIFIVPDNVYLRAITLQHTVTKHTGDVVVHKQTSSNKYVCWNYGNGIVSEIDFDTFNTQLNLFNYIKSDDDFYNTILKEILDNDLTELASQSALLFDR